MPEFSDPKELWLEPACTGNERCWCEDKIDDCAEVGCGLTAPKYIRADIVNEETSALRAENARLRAALTVTVDELRVYGNDQRDAEITRLRNIIKFRVLGWREHDWPEGFDRRTAEMIADNVRAALAQSSLDKPSRVGDGIAAGKLARWRSLAQAIIENDPDDSAADAVTCLDVWRKEAADLLAMNE